ncbi:MAG: TolC family protein [Proteobacteria bacterium]|nr:TolC family protein [Pseudomonadota bacterium]
MVILFCGIGSVGYADPEIITLERACELARENSPQIRAQKYDLESAEARLSEAKYYWAPKFELKSQFGPMPKTTDITDSEDDIWSRAGGSWGFTTRNYLDFWFPIFTSTKVYHTHELAKIGLQVEALRVENERLNVEYDVSRAYIGLQLANAANDVLKEAEGYVERIEKEYAKLVDQGSTEVKETDQYRIDIAKANLYRLRNTLEAKRDYAARALSVHTKLTLPIAVEEMDFDRNQPELKPYEDVLALAREHRGDLKLLAEAEAAAALESKIEWLNWWPDLVVAGEVYYKYSNAVPKLDTDNFFLKDSYNGRGFAIGFMLRWNLDPVRQVFRVRQADAKAEKMRAQRELAISGIELEVSEQYQTAVNHLSNIEITHKSRRSAKRFLTHELLAYEAGEGNVNELVSSLTTYIEQRSMYLQALHDYRTALVKLQKITGVSDVSELLIQ